MKKKIIEINSVEQLMELSGVGGAVGHVSTKEKQTEAFLRQYIRSKIKTIKEEKNKEEEGLRVVIRQMLREAKEVANPHPSTGINMLRDAFRKAKPTIKNQYQQLTTSKEQRDSFVAHLLAAFVRLYDQLDAMNASGSVKEVPIADTTPDVGGGDLKAPTDDDISAIEDEIKGIMEAIGVDIEEDDEEEDDMDIVSDEPKPETQTEKDVAKKKKQDREREDFAAGMEGEMTGRNQAFDTFRLTQSYFSDPYLDLADPDDQKMFKDWCLYNLDLLLSSFEEELQPGLDKPTIDSPEGA